MWSQEEGSVDWETTSTTESVYSTIAETLPGTVIDTDTAAAVGGLAAALKGVKLRAVTDTGMSSADFFRRILSCVSVTISGVDIRHLWTIALDYWINLYALATIISSY